MRSTTDSARCESWGSRLTTSPALSESYLAIGTSDSDATTPRTSPSACSTPGTRRAAPAASWAPFLAVDRARSRSEEHTSELQSRGHLVCRLLLEKKKKEGWTSWCSQKETLRHE